MSMTERPNRLAAAWASAWRRLLRWLGIPLTPTGVDQRARAMAREAARRSAVLVNLTAPKVTASARPENPAGQGPEATGAVACAGDDAWPSGVEDLLALVLRDLSAMELWLTAPPAQTPTATTTEGSVVSGASLVAPGERPVAGEMPTIRTLIDMADRIAMLSGEPGPERAAAVTRWLSLRLTELLHAHDVEIIDDEGAFDPERHEIVSVETTPDDALVGHIRETVRPGYRLLDQTLRPQHVIAYVAGLPPTDGAPHD